MPLPADFACPHCGKFLFKFVTIQGKGFRVDNAPALQEDHGKYFLMCPHIECRKRVDIDWRAEGRAPASGIPIKPNR